MFKKNFVAATLAALSCSAIAAPEVKLTTASPAVAVGEVFSVLLTGSSFDAFSGKSIDNISGAHSLTFSFTNSTLEVVGVTLAPQWAFGVNLGTVSQSAGTITGLRFGSFPALMGTNFEIGTVTLRAIAPGAGSLDLVSGTFQGRLGGRAGQSFSPAMGEVAITVTSAVPEPMSAALLLAGLGCVGFVARRRVRKL